MKSRRYGQIGAVLPAVCHSAVCVCPCVYLLLVLLLMVLSSSFSDWWWFCAGPVPSLGFHCPICKVDSWAWFQLLGNGLPKSGHLGILRPKHGGRATSHLSPDGRPPQAHAQGPCFSLSLLPLSYDPASKNLHPPNFTKHFLELREFCLKAKRAGRMVELGDFHPLLQEQPRFYLPSVGLLRKAVLVGCWGWRVIPHGLAPIVVAQRSSLCRHPCQGASW